MELYLGVLVLKYSDNYVRRRYPWQVKVYDDYPPGGTLAQRVIRARFQNCVSCFNAAPFSGGVEPPDKGPRSRQWWYSQAGAMWYYNYFIQQSMNTYLAGSTPDWCRSAVANETYVDSLYPNNNYLSSSYMYVSKDDDTGRERRIFCKTGGTLFQGIAAYMTSGFYGPAPGGDWPLKIYEVAGEYEPGILTWNNQPALGDLLNNQMLLQTPAAAWHAIYWTRYPVAFCITSPFSYAGWLRFLTTRFSGFQWDPYFTA